MERPGKQESWGTALVLGLGESGEAAARLLASEGTRVTVVDSAGGDALERRAGNLRAAGVDVRLGATSLPPGGADICVISPGLPADSAWMMELSRRRVPVIPELELGWMRCPVPVVAITGSNGKSTLAKLCAESLAAAGFRVELGANYGTPLSSIAMAGKNLDWIVAEVSSFQLETTVRFRPKVGVLLNLHPNHLDRHVTMQNYRSAKFQLFARQSVGDTVVIPEAFRADVVDAGARGARVWTFGDEKTADFSYSGAEITGPEGAKGWARTRVGGTPFESPVLGVSAAAAAAVVAACGGAPAALESAAKAFVPLSHRMQLLGEVRGVRFIDDSKATNLGAMVAALRVCGGHVRLIAGGLLKETDLGWVRGDIEASVRGIYLIGSAAPAMMAAWSGTVPCRDLGTLEVAVRAAFAESFPGDIILLSPACASFDQFSGYKERGTLFKSVFEGISQEE